MIFQTVSYIGIDAYPHLLIISCTLNVFFFALAWKLTIRSGAKTNPSLRALVKFFYLATASSVIPFAIFLYLAAQMWIKVVAALSVIFCELAYIRVMNLLVKCESAK